MELTIYELSNLSDIEKTIYLSNKNFIDLVGYYISIIDDIVNYNKSRFQVERFIDSLTILVPEINAKLIKKVQSYDPEIWELLPNETTKLLIKIDEFVNEPLWHAYKEKLLTLKNSLQILVPSLSKHIDFDISRSLMSNPEFIRLFTQLNKLNPSKAIYRDLFGPDTIHRKDGGPCPNDLADIDLFLDTRPNMWSAFNFPDRYRCGWAPTCVKARQIINDDFQHRLQQIKHIHERMNNLVRNIVAKEPIWKKDLINQFYNQNIVNMISEWIDKLESTIAGHARAKQKIERFRNWCRDMYNIDAQKSHIETVRVAMYDLRKNFSDIDLQLMAKHFNIDTQLNKNELTKELATLFFTDI